MQRDRAGDSREEALTYLDATVGDAGPGASRHRKEAVVDGVGSFVSLAERLGMRFARAAAYPDYYPERPGGKIGRAIEHDPSTGAASVSGGRVRAVRTACRSR